MNKHELVDAISKETETTKKAAEEALNAMLDAITASLKNVRDTEVGDTVTNPQTGSEIKIPASKAPVFKA